MLLTLPPSDTANNMCGATVTAVYELLLISLVGLTATSLAESKSLCLKVTSFPRAAVLRARRYIC